METLQAERKKKETQRKKIPKGLIYEMRHGKPIYYRDYDKVLEGEKSLEEVMGSSKLQAWIIDLIVGFLYSNLDRKKYKILLNKAGFQWAPKSWRNLDVAIFDREKLLKEGINNKYAKTPPEVVIEIDTKADLRKHGDFMNYQREKTQDLLDAGVKKVIWYTTFDKKVMVAEKDKPWIITDWDYEIEILDNLKFNLGENLKKDFENE
ncbi:Uma2 family endonuclease [Sulfurihydrogenibium subterraneum]|uniref:Uma2 family endonuclease n=1 Tax=Sulfurihydrogenibium subterraneum TaxID=171121 RepID=UPI00048D9474|nr:Uma2 family endonuclease [Sulfurihydrogenibium subterraneum]